MHLLLVDQIPNDRIALGRSRYYLRVTRQNTALNLKVGRIVSLVLRQQLAGAIVHQSQHVVRTSGHRALAVFGERHVHDGRSDTVGG